jgi:hypothetical protein
MSTYKTIGLGTAAFIVVTGTLLQLGYLAQYSRTDPISIYFSSNDENAISNVLTCNKVSSNISMYNESSSRFTTEDEKKFVIEPLKYFLEVKQVQLKPEWMFLVGLLMVTGGLFIKVMEVKKENKSLLDKIIKESASIKAEIRNVKNQDEQFYAKRKQDDSFENIENFNPNSNQGFNFTPPPPPKEPNIEVVEAEEIPNDED